MRPATGVSRICLSEYGPYESVSEIAANIGMTSDLLRKQLTITSGRISSLLSVESPFVLENDRVRVEDVAGLIRLTPTVELEVRPKFAGHLYENWREDFFLIASILRYGRILPHEALIAGVNSHDSIIELIARAIINLYSEAANRPIRTYKRHEWTSFDIDGEIDPESIILPEETGFRQSGISLVRNNKYNQVIFKAIEKIITEVQNFDTRLQLQQILFQLSPQDWTSRPVYNFNVPSRHRQWQSLYDLARMVLGGYGISYSNHSFPALPGYVIKTADAWESLLYSAIRVGIKGRRIRKVGYALGTRIDRYGKQSAVTATPDISIDKDGGVPFVIDAKYKGRIKQNGEEALSISSSDLYESLAFARATGSKEVLLFYPAITVNTTPPGTTEVFELVKIDDITVTGISIVVQGIGRTSGYRTFCSNLAEALYIQGA